MTDYNVSLNAANPNNSPKTQGGHQQNENVKHAAKPVSINIPSLTQFNPETREVEDIPSWNDRNGVGNVEEAAPLADKKDEISQKDRHTAWKEQQAKAAAERKAKQVEKQVKQQELARDYLKQNNLVKAAEALNMTPAELQLYVTNGALGIPPEKEAELTPEQKREKEYADFKAEQLKFKQETEQWKYNQQANEFIREAIAPILKDKEKYEFINQGDVVKYQSFIYEYMNKHFRETGETLSVADVADSIEENLYNSFMTSYEKMKGMKKLSKLFSQQQAEEQSQSDNPVQQGQVRVTQPKEVINLQSSLMNRKKNAAPVEETDDQDDVDTQLTHDDYNASILNPASRGKSLPFALLSESERRAQMKRERAARG